MSLVLDSSKPNVVAKAWGSPFPNVVSLSILPNGVTEVTPMQGIEMDMEMFCKAVEYFLFSENVVCQLSDKIHTVQLNFWGLMIPSKIRPFSKPFTVMNLDDFLCLVQYVFTNTNLEENDPRERFLNELVFDDPKKLQPGTLSVYEYLVNLQVVDGFQQIPAVPGLRRLVDESGTSAFGW